MVVNAAAGLGPSVNTHTIADGKPKTHIPTKSLNGNSMKASSVFKIENMVKLC